MNNEEEEETRREVIEEKAKIGPADPYPRPRPFRPYVPGESESGQSGGPRVGLMPEQGKEEGEEGIKPVVTKSQTPILTGYGGKGKEVMKGGEGVGYGGAQPPAGGGGYGGSGGGGYGSGGGGHGGAGMSGYGGGGKGGYGGGYGGGRGFGGGGYISYGGFGPYRPGYGG